MVSFMFMFSCHKEIQNKWHSVDCRILLFVRHKILLPVLSSHLLTRSSVSDDVNDDDDDDDNIKNSSSLIDKIMILVLYIYINY